jgi:hypothetical protein
MKNKTAVLERPATTIPETAKPDEKSILDELEIIKKKNGGAIPPAAVVQYAKDPETALHSKFTWDDGKAAEQYRLWQARQVLRVYVNITMPENTEPVRVRAFLSLPNDRKDGTGYRSLMGVIGNDTYREQMLEMAKRELKTFRYKYRTLSELAEVHKAIGNFIGDSE